MRRGLVLVGALVVVGALGSVGPLAIGRAEAQAVPVAELGSQLDQAALELAGLDAEVSQLEAAVPPVESELRKAEAERDDIRAASTSREQLRARLVGQARAYAVQRYMYGSGDSTDLLAFIAALAKPADDAVWGLATLEVTSAAALDEAVQVGKARAALEERLAAAESDVVLLTRSLERRRQELELATVRRGAAADRFAVVVRNLGQNTVNGMTTVAFQAYQEAEDTLAAEQPECGLRWELLAAIGKTESNHGAGRLDAFGNSVIAIIGIPIGADTDGGLLDGDAERDHAVGPMQFIPSTWQRWSTDANGDGRADPGNIIDAATAAGRYLCRAAGNLTLTTEAGVTRAILAYNPNQTYLRVVGARFESLASDLALGWFSAAALPPPPAPVPGLPSNAGLEGRPATGGGPPPPAPPTTKLTEVRVFRAQGLTVPTTAPVLEEPGRCLGPSLVLAERAGFFRCGPLGQPVVDPCEVAPFDATLVGCLPDPTGAPVLLRLAEPAALTAIGPVPPYRLLLLDGGDRCLPIPAGDGAEVAEVPDAAAVTSVTTATTSSTAATTSPSQPPSPTSGGPPSTEGPGSLGQGRGTGRSTDDGARAADTATTATTNTTEATTSTSTTVAPTTTTIPIAERPTYACVGGATVIGLPDTSAALWTVMLRQPGLADRSLAVAEALS